MAVPLPPTIGRYVVENLVGIGGMGQIFKAHDPDIGRPVAIKLISTELMSSASRAEYIKRFRREAQAAARCAHPNIVAIYDFALHEGQPFIAMEFVHGVSLRQALDAAPVMAVPDAVRIILQVLDALASAHEEGVVHQDVKPANIMLTPDMRVKVADFGICRFVNMEVTITTSSMGTPNYMSPEQCRGGPVDGRSDLFAAGATLFEMVAGEHAFPGRNVAEVTHRIQNEPLPMLPAPVRAVAPRLQLVLERAMGKQPEDRFDTGYEMAEALRQVLGGRRGDEEESTRVSPMPVAGDAPSQKAPADARPGTEPRLDADTLQALEHKLTDYVGPIARILVRTTSGRSRSVADLCSQLALSIADGAEREQFRREVNLLIRSRSAVADGASPPGAGTARSHRLPEHELERVQEALVQYVGPIARVLVRRATADASSVEALWLSLSNHIDSPAERATFLRQRQR
ncbi:MAG TPA: serine/threonine-protein kinase [Reyranella sp.]